MTPFSHIDSWGRDQSVLVNEKWIKAATLALVLLTQISCGERLSVEEYLARAEASMNAGDFKSADIDVRSALQESPDSAAGRYLMASVKLWQQQPEQAISELERSMTTQVSERALALLALAHLRANRIDEFFELVDAQSFAAMEDDPLFQSQLALGELARGNREAAEEAMAKAISLSPEMLEVQLASVDFDAAIGTSLDELIMRLESLLANRWQDYLVLRRLANVQSLSGHHSAAIESAEAALKLNPNLFEQRVLIARLQLQVGDAEGASATLVRAKKIAPQDPRINLLDAQLSYELGNYSESVIAVNEVLALYPKDPSALRLGAIANSAAGNLELARQQLTTLVSILPNLKGPLLQLARINIELEEFEAAEANSRAYLVDDADNVSALRLLAMSLSKLDRHEESSRALERALTEKPDSVAIKLLLGIELARAGKMTRAERLFGEAKASDPASVEVRNAILVTYVATGKKLEAQLEAAAFASANPKRVDAQLLAARTMAALKNDASAALYYEKAIALEATNVEANTGLAGLAVGAGDYTSALGFYSAIENATGTTTTLLLSKAIAYQKLGDTQQMIDTLQASIRAFPDAIDAKVALATHFIDRRQYREARAILTDISPDIIAQEPKLLNILGSIQYLMGEYELALARAKTLRKLEPTSADAYGLEYRSLLALDRNEDAVALLEQAVAGTSADYLHLQYLDYLIAEDRLEEAQITLEGNSATVLSPIQKAVYSAKIHLAKSDAASAIDALVSSHEATPTLGGALLLADAYVENKEAEKAVSLLDRWLDINPNDTRVLGKKAAYLLALGERKKALVSLLKLDQLQPGNAATINNIAWLYLATDAEEGLAWAEKARELDPDNPQILDTYAMALLENGLSSEALELTSANITDDPSEASFRLHHAKALLANGDAGDAKRLLRSVFDSEEHEAEAKALYKRLGGDG